MKGLPFTVFMMVAVGTALYFYNLYFLGWVNDGWRFDRPMKWLGFHPTTTDQNGRVNPLGFLFGGTGAALTTSVLWFVVPTLLMQFLRKGPAGTLEAWRKGPATVRRHFAQSGPAATAELCVGAGTGLVIGACAFGYSSFALAAGLGVFLGSQGSRVVSLLVSSMWSATQSKLRGPAGAAKPSEASGFIAMLGGIGGLLIRQGLPTGLAFVAGLGLLGFSLFSTRGALARSTPLLAFIVFAGALVFVPSLFADDGGFVEWAQGNGTPLTFASFLRWLRETGQAGNVRDLALLHAIYTAALGGGLGGWWRALAELPPELANQFQGPTAEQQRKQSPARPPTERDSKPDLKPDQRAPKPSEPPKTDPSLVDPYTGEPLIVNDGSKAGGKRGQVKFGDRWMDPDEARELIAENQRAIANRDQQRQEFVDESRRKSDDWMQKHANPDPEPEPVEPDVAQKLNRLRDLGDKTLANVTDPAQRDFMRNFLDRHSDDPDAMRRAIHAIQTHNSANAEDDLVRAAWWNGATETAADTRDWAMTANRILARFNPAGRLIVQGQGLITGAIDAYDQGGLTGAGGKTLATLADNALSRELGIPTGGIISTIYNNGGDLSKSVKDWSNQYNPAEYARRLNDVRTNWPDNPLDGIRNVVDTGLDGLDARDDLRQARDAYRNRGAGPSDESPSSPPPKPEHSTPADTPPTETKTTHQEPHAADSDPATRSPATPETESPPTTARPPDAPTTPDIKPPHPDSTKPSDVTPSAKDDAAHATGEAPPAEHKDKAQPDAPPADDTTKAKTEPPPRTEEVPPRDKEAPPAKDETGTPPVDERQARIEREREKQRLQMEEQKRRQEQQTPPQDQETPAQEQQAKHRGDGETKVESKTDTEPGATADPPPRTRPTKAQLDERRHDFENRVRAEYWREYARQIKSGEVHNPFGKTAIPANPEGTQGGSAPVDNLQRMANGDPPIGSDGLSVQLHHKVPLKAGGTNDYDNLLPFTKTTHSRASRILHKEPYPGNQWQGDPDAGDIKHYGASRRRPKAPPKT